MTEPTMHPRSHYEAVLDVRYGLRFNELNERLYRRLDLLFGFVGLFGGTSAFVAVVGSAPVLAACASALVAASAVIERLVRPVEKAVAHAEFRRRFGDLDARSGALDLVAVDAELRRLQADGPLGFAALARPAFNANLRSNGRQDALTPESRLERFAAWFA